MIKLMMILCFSLFLSAENGADLFKKCATCHGVNGEKVYAGKVPAIAGGSLMGLAKKIRSYREGEGNTYGMGSVMKAQTAGLSDSDVKALATYISNLKK